MSNKTFKITGSYTPKEAFHPGEYLYDELTARSITQREFAVQIGIAPSALNELIAGKRNISPMLAVKLETVLGISADTWIRLQAQYELDAYRISTKPPGYKIKIGNALQAAEPTADYTSNKLRRKK